MKSLKEYFTGYPTTIGNAQSQEYQGVFGPFDAEAVQGQDRLDPRTAEGLDRLNSFLRYFFRRATLNPHNDIVNLRARLNHMNLDFPFDNTQSVQPEQNFLVGKTEVFGTTPTTDLSKGFDTGSDVPVFNLNIKVDKGEDGHYIRAVMTPHNKLTEEMIRKSQRDMRIKKIKKIKEDYEVGPYQREAQKAESAIGPRGTRQRARNFNIAARRRMEKGNLSPES